jgi:hypothetical protein
LERDRVAKRYVLLVADQALTKSDVRDLSEVLERRHGKVKVIVLRDDPSGIVVRTTNDRVPFLRDPDSLISVGGKRLTPTLTSGSIGKLKRRRSGTGATGSGEVHE